MTTARKLWLGFGALTALLVLLGALMFIRLQSIGRNVHIQAEVSRPRWDATQELELRFLDYALNVDAHLAGSPGRMSEANKAAAEIERQLAEYETLAEASRHRELAADCKSQWRELNALGETLMDAVPAQEDVERFVALRIRLQTFMDGEMQRDARESYNARKAMVFDDIGAMAGFLGILTSGCVVIALVTSVAVGRSIVRTEDALRERTERYELVAAGAGDAIWDWDVLNHQVYFSPRWKELRGFATGEVSDREEEWSSRIHPEDYSRVMASVAAHFGGKTGFFAEEYRTRCKDGSWKWILDRGIARRDSTGRVVRMAGSESEITERKRAEEALRDREARLLAILNTAGEAIVTIDHRGIIQSVNPATEKIFGYASTALVGQNVSLLMPSPDRERHDGYLQRYLETGVAHIIGVGRELTAQHKDGSLFPVDVDVSEVRELNLFTAILRDITRRKELERDVVEIASLEQRRIGQDLHDSVGQELTALNMLAGDLAESLRTDPENGLTLVEQIVQGLQRSRRALRAVMRGLLPVAVDSEGLMAALSDLADRIQREVKVTCKFDCPEPVSVADNLTATHLYLIAQEAVHNAVKHGQPKNIRISLESNDLLALSVQDDGIGMPVEPTETHGGLGLRIMRNRASIIGATLTIQPAEPTGTLVSCALPRKNHET